MLLILDLKSAASVGRTKETSVSIAVTLSPSRPPPSDCRWGKIDGTEAPCTRVVCDTYIMYEICNVMFILKTEMCMVFYMYSVLYALWICFESFLKPI